MTSEIQAYLKQLLVDAGQTDLPADVETMMLEDLNQRLEDKLILTAMQSLSEEKQMELEKMASEAKNPGQPSPSVDKFLKENIDDYEQVFANALIEFHNTYVEATKKQ